MRAVDLGASSDYEQTAVGTTAVASCLMLESKLRKDFESKAVSAPEFVTGREHVTGCGLVQPVRLTVFAFVKVPELAFA